MEPAGRGKPRMLALDGSSAGGLDGWVSRPFLPATPPCTTGFTPLAGSICPTEPTESEPQRTLAVHPLPSATPFRATPDRTDVVSSTTERAAIPLPPALLSNKLQLRIRAFCSIGFYLHRPRIAPEVDCISVEISAPRKYPSFRGCEIDTHSALANRILKGIGT